LAARSSCRSLIGAVFAHTEHKRTGNKVNWFVLSGIAVREMAVPVACQHGPAAALGNSVFDATCVRLRLAPLTRSASNQR
jgi:hypothetical protein